MSLDVYLYETTGHVCSQCGHADPVEASEVYEANITHNLGDMANETGIYLALWRPGEMLSPKIAACIREQREASNWHGPGGVFELERQLPTPFARDLIDPLRAGLALLKSDPRRFEQFNAPNGWGLYRHFVPFVEKYLEACEANPTAIVKVSR